MFRTVLVIQILLLIGICEFSECQSNITAEVRQEAQQALKDSSTTTKVIYAAFAVISALVGGNVIKLISEDIDSLFGDDSKGLSNLSDQGEEELDDFGPDSKPEEPISEDGVSNHPDPVQSVVAGLNVKAPHEKQIMQNIDAPIPEKKRGLARFQHTLHAFREAPWKRKIYYLGHFGVIITALVKVIVHEVGSGRVEGILQKIISQ